MIPPPKARSAKSRRRRRALLIVLVIALLGAVATGAGLYAAGAFSSVVPNVIGTSPAQAQAALRKAGCTHVQTAPGPVNSETIHQGDVVSVEPAAGSVCKELFNADRTITLTLSAGPKTYTIPDVAGLNPDQARSRLQGVGPLDVVTALTTVNSLTVPAQQVIRTNPPAGSVVDARQPITIVESLGPPLLDVPNVPAGTSVDDARSILGKFSSTFDQQDYSDTVEKGAVISCTPNGGQALQGSKVSCDVSKGPQFVTVPDIPIGTQTAQAVQTLKAAGLTPAIVGGTGSTGAVIAINPSARTQVQIGSTVTVFVVGG